jgi:hypothetical protein
LCIIRPKRCVTYRTDIVAGVVQKKKIACEKLKFDDVPASPTSTGSFAFESANSESDISKLTSLSINRDVVKKGWGVKRGHVRKNWKRRFFVLHSDSFTYYKSEKDEDAIRTIPLHEILTAKVGSEGNSDDRENLFMVVTTDKISYIQVETLDELNSWISCFDDTIKSHRQEYRPDEKIEERFANHRQIFKSNSFKDKMRSKLQW